MTPVHLGGSKHSFGIKVSGWQWIGAFLNPGVLKVGSLEALFSDRYFSSISERLALPSWRRHAAFCRWRLINFLKIPLCNVTRNLTKAFEWSKDWNRPLNLSKCVFLTFGSSPFTPYSPFDGGPERQQLQSIKKCSLKPSAYRIAAVKKARADLYLIKLRS